jgi:hypothetical protein
MNKCVVIWKNPVNEERVLCGSPLVFLHAWCTDCLFHTLSHACWHLFSFSLGELLTATLLRLSLYLLHASISILLTFCFIPCLQIGSRKLSEPQTG